MATSIGTVFLNIGAKLDGLKKGLQKSLKMSKETFAKMAKMASAAALAIGVALTAAIVKSVTAYAKAGDEIHKMALRTGFSTEALSELKFAFEQSGASIETLEKGVKRMASTLEDARDGLKTGTDVMDKFGMSVEDFDGLSPEDAFFKLANAIAEIEDPLRRSALAQDVFGRSGTEMLPFLAAGTEGIAALRQEARDLGIVFDQEGAQAAADFTDNMNSLKNAFIGLSNQIADAVIPIFNEWLPRIKEALTSTIEWAEANKPLVAIIAKIALVMGPVLIAMGTLGLMLGPLMLGMAALGGPAGIGIVIAALAGPLGLIAGIIAGAAAFIFIGWAIAQAINAFLDFRKAKDDLKEREEAWTQQVKDSVEMLKEEGVAFDETKLEGKSLGEQLDILKAAAIRGMAQRRATVQSLGEEQRTVSDTTDKYWDLTEAMAAALEQARQMSQGGGGGRGGGGYGYAGEFAHGGFVPAGMSALVGEQGPELINTRRGGGVDVSSNRATRGMGGTTVNLGGITINARTDDPDKLANLVAGKLDTIFGQMQRGNNLKFGVANG